MNSKKNCFYLQIQYDKLHYQYIKKTKELNTLKYKMELIKKNAKNKISIDFLIKYKDTNLVNNVRNILYNDPNFLKPLNKDLKNIVYSFFLGKVIYTHAYSPDLKTNIKITKETSHYVEGIDKQGRHRIFHDFVKYNRL